MKTLDFRGQAVVVTGGARGLGRVIAETFMAAGADVVVCGRHEPPADELPRATGPDGEDRVAATRRLAEALGATVLLKGNVTVIADPTGPVYLNPAGGAWAATAGSGDVLSGMIGALLSSGLPPIEAAAAAAFVHARAANASAADPGPSPVPTSASRILAHIRQAVATL